MRLSFFSKRIVEGIRGLQPISYQRIFYNPLCIGIVISFICQNSDSVIQPPKMCIAVPCQRFLNCFININRMTCITPHILFEHIIIDSVTALFLNEIQIVL